MSETKSFPVEIIKAADPKYTATFVLSAPTEDRVNDTIDPAAYEPYVGKTLIALFDHESEKPFGAWENLRIKGKKLIGDLRVAGTKLGDMIKQLLDDAIPLGASIGFRPVEYTIKDDGGWHFLEIEILECSICSVPAHPLAARVKSILSDPQSSADADFEQATSGRDVDPEAVVRNAKAAILGANKTIRGRK